MFDYERTFDQRGDLYNRAGRLCPRARETERRLLIDGLALEDGQVVCDAPAGGGYLADGIGERTAGRNPVICVEPSAVFARGIDPAFRSVVCRLDRLALSDACVERVGSLAGLHHLGSKLAFFREAARILRPGGRFAVADALEGTPTARFLNDVGDRLSETGHRGVFLAGGELTSLLEQAGFVDIGERHEEYTWDFPDVATMTRYCMDLFGLTRATPEQARTEIERALRITPASDGVHLAWSLVYAAGVHR